MSPAAVKPMRGRARPRRQRRRMAAIRALWSFVMPAIGFIVTYVAESWANLGIAQVPIALALGALAYGAKRYWFPDTEF